MDNFNDHLVDPPTEINYTLFNKIMEVNDFTKMDMNLVVKHIYDATYMHYSLMFNEAKREEAYMYEKVLEKNKKIEELESEVTRLREIISEAGLELLEENT